MTRWHIRVMACVLAASLVGCSTTTPYVGQGPHPQITRGHPLPPIDFLGNVFAILSKIILFNWKIDNHTVSAETEAYLVKYIDSPITEEGGTHFSLNEYAPGRALARLVHNHKVAWPYRLLLGFPVTLISDILLPGRLFAGLLSGDAYNPFTDTVSLYSDLPSVALHEAGHAHDFNSRHFKGTYAAARLIPFVDLYQEFQATDEALRYFIETNERQQELSAYKILYPAYGTYVGGYLFIIGGSVIGAVVGHIWGRAKARSRVQYYQKLDALQRSKEAAASRPQPVVTP